VLIHKTRFEKLLSFLQGASWALALAGGFYLFLAFLPFGFVVASIWVLFYFFLVLFLRLCFNWLKSKLINMKNEKTNAFIGKIHQK